MKRIVNNKFFKTILPNIVIVISCMMVTLIILDYYNPLMGFLSRGMSVGVIVSWIVALIMYIVALCMRCITGVNKLPKDIANENKLV